MIIKKIKENPVKFILILFILIILLNKSFNNVSYYTGNKIGLIEINMPIMKSDKIIKDLNYFKNNEDVKAIVVRVDTPGGAVAASQEIYLKIKQISNFSKPVYVSMGNVAASGGYYLSLGADTIIANSGTATGSIGVIMGYPIINEFMENIGIEYKTIKSALYKDAGSAFRSQTNSDSSYLQILVDDLHDQFINAIVLERGIDRKKVEKLANGKVYSGIQALENNLIDMIGTLEDAYNIANNRLDASKEPIILLPPKEKEGIFDMILNNINTSTTFNYSYPIPLFRMLY